ncbi:uncharacterized protein LOC117123529 isoform X1 [Anneissia japonica]|uniref:uncharacterized protein LOC117123529 isoform X1 n=1 Tax=Anneissia japonica TaxID=1529436 RepID=UPI0014254E76|nr:uncharacterized protein LOC117123529 isoform X1 [Anneissia japonica]
MSQYQAGIYDEQDDDAAGKIPRPQISPDDLANTASGLGANPFTVSKSFKMLDEPGTGAPAPSIFSGDVTGKETAFKRVKDSVGGYREPVKPGLNICIICGEKLVSVNRTSQTKQNRVRDTRMSQKTFGGSRIVGKSVCVRIYTPRCVYAASKKYS